MRRAAAHSHRSGLLTTLLWGVLPYVAFALLIAGLIWRYRYDTYGWTTRSSQVYESKLLNIASPAVHHGTLFVPAGHLIGLFVPLSWTDGIGVGEIALVPCTRLVHMFSAPLQYLFRPYVVYRSRDPRQLGPRPERRGWEKTRI